MNEEDLLAIKVKVHAGQHPELHRVLTGVANPRLRSGRLKALALAGLQWEKAQAGDVSKERSDGRAKSTGAASPGQSVTPGAAAAVPDPLLGVLSWDDSAG